MNKISSLELKVPPVAVFFIFAALMWLATKALPFADIALPARKLIAIGIAAVGGVYAGAAIWSFLRARTTLNPMDPGKAASLVTGGVYAVSRNPMYASLLIVLAGWAIYLSNLATLLLLPLFVAYMDRFQIMPEERALASLFGGGFEAYRTRVRRWL